METLMNQFTVINYRLTRSVELTFYEHMRAIVMFIGNLLFIKDTLHANVFIFLICYIILRLHVDNVYDL